MLRLVFAALIVALSHPALADAFADYRAIQIALASANVTDETVAKARNLFPDQITLIEKMESAARSDQDYFIAKRQTAQAAYHDFILLPANQDVLHGFIAHQLAFLEKLSVSQEARPGMILAWGWATLSEAAVIGYEATGDQRFIDQALRIFRVSYENTDDARGITEDFNRENVRGWSFDHYGKTGREHTFAGRIIAPMLRLAIAVKGKNIPDATAREIQKHAADGIEILKAHLQFQIIDGDKRYYKYIFTGEQDAFNHIASYTLAASYAYELTGDKEFRDVCDGFLNYLFSHVEVGENGAYAWDYQINDDPKKRHRSELWKEAITISAIAYMNERGIGVASKHKKGLTRGFTTYIARQNRTVHAKMGTDYFPLTAFNLMKTDYIHVQLFMNYMPLDQWSPEIREIILDTVASRSDLFPEGLLSGFFSAPAYAHMLRYNADATISSVMQKVLDVSKDIWGSIKPITGR
ncbi:hypothetical protein [Hyphomicrobium sp. D-2]|uniref:hypothetical protein n=1 Tax=Hyphomicrobium sp. D-2 TaxID=3041621 RepID=UPI00245653E8|nr:hypothetical protein [Hyphomicrobium sp. D-2]MDH4981932.1 hypothetical protein [Hyphomicrobium sp. D-2]